MWNRDANCTQESTRSRWKPHYAKSLDTVLRTVDFVTQVSWTRGSILNGRVTWSDLHFGERTDSG